MTAAGDARYSFTQLEGRIREIENGLLDFQLPAMSMSVHTPKPARPPLVPRWGLTALLAICGSAALIGPFLLIVSS